MKKNSIHKKALKVKILRNSLKSYNYIYSIYYPIYIIFKHIGYNITFYIYLKVLQKLRSVTEI